MKIKEKAQKALGIFLITIAIYIEANVIRMEVDESLPFLKLAMAIAVFGACLWFIEGNP